MTGDMLTGPERCKRRLVLRAGGILGVKTAFQQPLQDVQHLAPAEIRSPPNPAP